MSKPEATSRRVYCRWSFLVLLSLVMMFASGNPARLAAQTHEQNGFDRKLITRIEPDYPDTLKKLYIGGAVRVEVTVAPNGTVKSATLIGGNPILGQSAMKAMKQWKYAPAASEETFTVKLDFDPHR